MKKFLSVCAFAAVCGLAFWAIQTPQIEGEVDSWKRIPKRDRIREAQAWYHRLTQDPATGTVPQERLSKVYDLAIEQNETQYKINAKSGSIANADWSERGPSNVGGRTRSIVIDSRDPSGKTVWAGSVGGGVWKTDDITSATPNWQRTSPSLSCPFIGALAQHPNQPNTFFAGTGEYQGSGGPSQGDGIYRTVDGGANWVRLAATNGNTVFYNCQRLAIHPTTNVIYAATQNGVWSSSNNGDNWSIVPGMSGWTYDVQISPNGDVFGCDNNQVFKLTNGSFVATSFSSNAQRVVMSICRTNPLVMYAVGVQSWAQSFLYKSTNGGVSWTLTSEPGIQFGGNFINFASQGPYCVDVAVDPFDPNLVVVGGLDLYRSTNGGQTWNMLSLWIEGNQAGLQYVHADQHMCMFDQTRSGICYFSNDGGIWRSANRGGTIGERNLGYNVTQFYSGDLHPTEDVFIAGAQDNGTNLMIGTGVQPSREVIGGDGMFCHISQSNPNFMMGSVYNGAYSLSTDGGQTFSDRANSKGSFVSPSDLDDNRNILYCQTDSQGVSMYRYDIPNRRESWASITGINGGNVNTIKVSPNVPDRIYIGTYNGELRVIDNANTGTNITSVRLRSFGGGATVNGIAVQDGNENHMLVTIANYGATSVWETFNGGATWTAVEGNLPDMPVFCALFNPNDSSQAIIGTSVGVWSTDRLNGVNTVWDAPNYINGSPLVEVRQLQIRSFDKLVLAVTHGRGVFTSDVFALPKAIIDYDGVAYTNAGTDFRGERSLKTNNEYFWQFGDGSTSSAENPSHSYTTVGSYVITLTVNSGANSNSTTTTLTVLPTVQVPYENGITNWQGGFEGNVNHFASFTKNQLGSRWQIGNYTRTNSPQFTYATYKNQAFEGQNAMVIDPTGDFYKPSSNTTFYTPNFDFSRAGIYSLNFMGKWKFSNGLDGFNIEYTLDKGRTWNLFGSNSPDWYNTSGIAATAFRQGLSFFSSQERGVLADKYYKLFERDASQFSGNPNVAFRFTFKSINVPYDYPGAAIDNFQIQFNENAFTELVQFDAAFEPGETVRVEWQTSHEFRCRRFELERSTNGADWATYPYRVNQVTGQIVINPITNQPVRDTVANIVFPLNVAAPGSSIRPRSYSYPDVNLRDNQYFYRLKVVSYDAPQTFYSRTVRVCRNCAELGVSETRHTLNANDITLVFTDILETGKKATYEVFNSIGQVMDYGRVTTGGTTAQQIMFNRTDLSSGVYYLKVSIEGRPKAFVAPFVVAK